MSFFPQHVKVVPRASAERLRVSAEKLRDSARKLRDNAEKLRDNARKLRDSAQNKNTGALAPWETEGVFRKPATAGGLTSCLAKTTS
jgi:hypothetical protein